MQARDDATAGAEDDAIAEVIDGGPATAGEAASLDEFELGLVADDAPFREPPRRWASSVCVAGAFAAHAGLIALIVATGLGWQVAAGVSRGYATAIDVEIDPGLPRMEDVAQAAPDAAATALTAKSPDQEDIAAIGAAPENLAPDNPEPESLISESPDARDLAAPNLAAPNLAAPNLPAQNLPAQNLPAEDRLALNMALDAFMADSAAETIATIDPEFDVAAVAQAPGDISPVDADIVDPAHAETVLPSQAPDAAPVLPDAKALADARPNDTPQAQGKMRELGSAASSVLVAKDAGDAAPLDAAPVRQTEIARAEVPEIAAAPQAIASIKSREADPALTAAPAAPGPLAAADETREIAAAEDAPALIRDEHATVTIAAREEEDATVTVAAREEETGEGLEEGSRDDAPPGPAPPLPIAKSMAQSEAAARQVAADRAAVARARANAAAAVKRKAETNRRLAEQRKADARRAAQARANAPRIAAQAAARRYVSMVRGRVAARKPAMKGPGSVSVAFAIAPNGSLRYAQLAKRSGRFFLDQASVAAVRRAGPFPPPPPGMSPGQLSFTVPFTFR